MAGQNNNWRIKEGEGPKAFDMKNIRGSLVAGQNDQASGNRNITKQPQDNWREQTRRNVAPHPNKGNNKNSYSESKGTSVLSQDNKLSNKHERTQPTQQKNQQRYQPHKRIQQTQEQKQTQQGYQVRSQSGVSAQNICNSTQLPTDSGKQEWIKQQLGYRQSKNRFSNAHSGQQKKHESDQSNFQVSTKHLQKRENIAPEMQNQQHYNPFKDSPRSNANENISHAPQQCYTYNSPSDVCRHNGQSSRSGANRILPQQSTQGSTVKKQNKQTTQQSKQTWVKGNQTTHSHRSQQQQHKNQTSAHHQANVNINNVESSGHDQTTLANVNLWVPEQILSDLSFAVRDGCVNLAAEYASLAKMTTVTTDHSQVPISKNVVIITNFFKPNVVFIRRSNNADIQFFEKLKEHIQLAGKTEKRLPTVPKLGTIVLVKHNSIYYRAVVHKVQPNGTFIVSYQDYGYVREHNSNDTFELAANLQAVPALAVPALLKNIPNMELTEELSQYMQAKTDVTIELRYDAAKDWLKNENVFQVELFEIQKSNNQDVFCINDELMRFYRKAKQRETTQQEYAQSNVPDQSQENCKPMEETFSKNKTEDFQKTEQVPLLQTQQKQQINDRLMRWKCEENAAAFCIQQTEKQAQIGETQPKETNKLSSQCQEQAICQQIYLFNMLPYEKLPLNPNTRLVIIYNGCLATGKIYCSLQEGFGKMAQLQNQLQIYMCLHAQLEYTPTQKDELCFVLGPDDLTWFRGRVLEILIEDMFQIKCFDYGYNFVVSSNKIRKFNEMFIQEINTVECVIKDFPSELDESTLNLWQKYLANFSCFECDKFDFDEENNCYIVTLPKHLQGIGI